MDATTTTTHQNNHSLPLPLLPAMEPPSPSPSPRSSRKAAAPRVVSVLAGLLERAAERGDAEGEGAVAASAAAFRGRALPGIPVRRYVERIYRYAGCSPACFVVAYVYLDRLARGCRGRHTEEEEDVGGSEEETAVVSIDSYSVHRLLITSVLVAAKFMDDRHYNNAYFARVGGVEVSEMNALELRLLFALRFRLNVDPDTFARYCAALECHIVMADDPAVPLPLLLMPAPVSDDDGGAVTTKAENGAAAAGGGGGSAVPVVVVVQSHRHRRAVVQIMTTAQ